MLKRELESKIFDLDRDLQQCKIFEEIGDGKLEKMVDKYYKLLEKYKVLRSTKFKRRVPLSICVKCKHDKDVRSKKNKKGADKITTKAKKKS